MPLVAKAAIPGLTREQYDAMRAEIGWLEREPEGGCAHIAWWEGDVYHQLDVWENEEAFAKFGQERVAPAMARLGMEGPPPEVTFHEAYEVFSPRSVQLTV